MTNILLFPARSRLAKSIDLQATPLPDRGECPDWVDLAKRPETLIALMRKVSAETAPGVPQTARWIG